MREYEDILEPLNAKAGVVLSSTLASLPLLGDEGATLLARMSGKTLTTVVVNAGRSVRLSLHGNGGRSAVA